MLDAVVGRFAEYRGYWALGQMVPQLEEWNIDLLGCPSDEPSVAAYLHRRAARVFTECRQAEGIPEEWVQTARLRVVSCGEEYARLMGWFPVRRERIGRDYVLEASTSMESGARFSLRRTAFVAPHDPSLEMASSGDAWEMYGDIGLSPIDYYRAGPDFAGVWFSGGTAYIYTYKSAGPDHVERMKELARAGEGLLRYITAHVKYAYEAKGPPELVCIASSGAHPSAADTAFDLGWLVELVRDQIPDEPWLLDALAKCTRPLSITPDYVRFVSAANPNSPGSEWQYEYSEAVEAPAGTVVIDILRDGRIGGIELV